MSLYFFYRSCRKRYKSNFFMLISLTSYAHTSKNIEKEFDFKVLFLTTKGQEQSTSRHKESPND